MSSFSHPGDVVVSPQDSCLHLILRSSGDVLEDCLPCIASGDSVVLMDTAVVELVQPGGNRWLAAGVRVYCLEADLLAHGLAQLAGNSGVERVDDARLVELVCRHGQCLSWK